MWVKICGITRYEDAFEAVQLGADAIGFVLTPSPRRADPDGLKTWMHTIHWVEKIGVFTHEDPQLILNLGQSLGLSSIQLHCDLTPQHAILFEHFEIIYALHDPEMLKKDDNRSLTEAVTKGLGKPNLQKRFPQTPSKELLDVLPEPLEVFVGGLGGTFFKKCPPGSCSTGSTVGGAALRSKAGDLACRIMIDGSMGTGKAGNWAPRGYPYILAGGLNPHNVAQAIAKAHPVGVDVSSGVEVSPGIKDAQLMERFIKEART